MKKGIFKRKEERECAHCKIKFITWMSTTKKYCSKYCMYTDPIWIQKQRDITHSDETKKLLGKQSALRNAGKGNPMYKNGLHHMRRLIKEKANGICMICNEGLEGVVWGYLDIHHADGNHENNVASNLIAICPNCHRKEHLKIINKIKNGK